MREKRGLTEQTAFFRELRWRRINRLGSEKRCQFLQSPFFQPVVNLDRLALLGYLLVNLDSIRDKN